MKDSGVLAKWILYLTLTAFLLYGSYCDYTKGYIRKIEKKGNKVCVILPEQARIQKLVIQYKATKYSQERVK